MAGPRRGEGWAKTWNRRSGSVKRAQESPHRLPAKKASTNQKEPCMPVIRRVRERRRPLSILRPHGRAVRTGRHLRPKGPTIIVGHDSKPSPNTIQCTGFHDMTTNVLRKCSHRIAAKPHLVTEARGIHKIVQELTAPLPVRILRSRNAATRLADAPILVLSNKYWQRESLESLFPRLGRIWNPVEPALAANDLQSAN